MARSQSVDPEQARRFLAALGEGPHTFQVFAENGNPRPRPWHWTADFDAVFEYLKAANRQGAGVYVMLNLADGKGRRKENVTAVRGVFVDLDGAPLEPVLNCGLTPHIVTETSPGRYHVVWRVADLPADDKLFREVQQGLAKRFDADSQCKDLGRVIRMPGFLHQKGEPFMVRIVEINDHEPCTYEQIRQILPPEEPKSPRPAPKPTSGDASAYVRAAVEGEVAKVAAAPEGERNAKLNAAAFSLAGLVHTGQLDQRTIASELLQAALAAGLSEHEAKATITSGIRAGLEHPRQVTDNGRVRRRSHGSAKSTSTVGLDALKGTDLTELATARRLRGRYGKRLKHATGLGWLGWDGARWAISEKTACRCAHDMGRIIREELKAKGLDDPEVARAFYAHARNIEKATGTRAVLELAKALKGIDADHIEWDAHPWLLNCPNGTVDLRTGKLREHRKEDFLTKLCPTPYKPKATAPRLEQFLGEVFSGDTDLVGYFQWFLGLCLTGCTDFDLFGVWHGDGANGKTTGIRLIQEAMGEDYAQQLDPEELMLQKHARHTTELAQLRGARFVAAVETTAGRRLNESLVKALTGGDKIRARFMRQDSFEFVPELKLVISTNARPAIRDDSSGMWRRIRLFPFEERFDGDRCDPWLLDRLLAEREGALAWIVEGAKRVPDGEPPLPIRVQAATDAYREEQDSLAGFIDECCELCEHATVPKAEFYRAYRAWTNNRCENQQRFSKRMQARGFSEKHVKTASGSTARAWVGIALIDKDLARK